MIISGGVGGPADCAGAVASSIGIQRIGDQVEFRLDVGIGRDVEDKRVVTTVNVTGPAAEDGVGIRECGEGELCSFWLG